MNTSEEHLKPIALVYLISDGDERNKCILTEDSIVLIRKGKKFAFDLKSVNKLSFSSKLFLLPLVLGGVFGPFSFIAILNNSFHPVISLLGFLLSLMAFYLGISRKKSFVIETDNDKKEIFLYSISENLRQFTRFINAILSGQKKEDILTFYFKITNDRLGLFKQTKKLEFDKNGEFALFREELERVEKKDETYIPVNYTIPTIQIKFEKTPDNRLKPKIFGILNYDEKFTTLHP